MNVSISGFGLASGQGGVGHVTGQLGVLRGLLLQARSGRVQLRIGYRFFDLGAGEYGLSAPDTGLFFSSWGPDDFYHTAIVPAEDSRDMEILEEVRDVLVPTRRIGYP